MSERQYLSSEQKVSILRRHLVEGTAVSDLCDEFKIHPTQFYKWQRVLFEGAAVLFDRQPNKANVRRQEEAATQKIAQLEEKIQQKNTVIAELLEEHVQLKKAHGEP